MLRRVLNTHDFFSVSSWIKSSPPDLFLEKGVLKKCTAFTGEHTCRSVISIKLLWDFIEILIWDVCSPVNLLHFFRTPFLKNTSRSLLLLNVILYSIRSNIKQTFFQGHDNHMIKQLWIFIMMQIWKLKNIFFLLIIDLATIKNIRDPCYHQIAIHTIFLNITIL